MFQLTEILKHAVERLAMAIISEWL